MSKMTQLTLMGSLLLAVGTSGISQASVIYSESFNYTVGSDLIATGSGSTGWSQRSYGILADVSSTVGNGLSFTGVTSSGGSAQLNTVLDVHSAAIGTGVSFYASALFNKADTTGRVSVGFLYNPAPATPTYFAGFGINGDGKLTAGDGRLNTTWTTAAATSVTTATTAMLVAYVDVTAHTISVWNVTDTTAPLGTPGVTFSISSNSVNVNSISVSYTGNNKTAINRIDELRVGTTLADVGIVPAPEPASLGVLALGGLLLIQSRKRGQE